MKTYLITEICPLCHVPTSQRQEKTEVELLNEVHCDLNTSPVCDKCKTSLNSNSEFCTCNAPDYVPHENEVQEGGQIVTKNLGEYCYVCGRDKAPKEVNDET